MEKKAILGAIAICAMSWAAIPLIYYLLKKRENEEDKKTSSKERDESQKVGEDTSQTGSKS